MDRDTTESTNQQTRSEGTITLDAVLNVLWRRRLIVLSFPLLGLAAGSAYSVLVTPLYLATATIRPGITAFDPNGGGHREWRLKDLTRWYESRAYVPWTAELMECEQKDVPLIRANFIQRGLQNIQGGNVITLSVMDASPSNAVEALDASIEGFKDYAMADTLSNSITLTRRGLKIQVDELRRYRSLLASKVDSLDVELSVAKSDSLRIDAEARRLDLELQRFIDKREAQSQQIETLEYQLTQLADNRQELVRTRAKVGERLGASSEAEMPSGVRPEAMITDAEVFRGLVDNTADLDERAAAIATKVSNLRAEIRTMEREVEYTELRNQRQIRFQREEAAKRLAALRRGRDVTIPSALRSVDLRIREKLGQLHALSPIEVIGRVQASEEPVRPRKKRAVSILVFLGILGGIAAAYLFDYTWAHRKRIFHD